MVREIERGSTERLVRMILVLVYISKVDNYLDFLMGEIDWT